MCGQRRIVVALFLCLSAVVLLGCKSKTKTISPNWEIWNSPSMVLALDETDPQDDDFPYESYGSTADWSLMKGTYDAHFVYIHADVYSSPDVDQTGDIGYQVYIDSNGNSILDAGDYWLWWVTGFGAIAFDYLGNSVSIPGAIRIDPDGGIDYAIGRSLVNQTSFKVSASILGDSGDGDLMPDAGEATFTF